MIAYFDTSALVPLVVPERSSELCRQTWSAAHQLVTSRLSFVEVPAALARAQRTGRLNASQRDQAAELLAAMMTRFEVIEVDKALARNAGDLALASALRGYDAVHCASAVAIASDELVAVSGDKQLLTAWHSLGLAVIDTAA